MLRTDAYGGDPPPPLSSFQARYPNCDDITDVNCYTLNASAATGNPHGPVVDAAHNVEVVNQNGFWMTNGSSNVTAAPHEVIAVDHSNTAWRCPHDCGWIAYSQHRAEVCRTAVCRFDQTHNVPYWDQQVSGGFYYNATSTAAWAPSWTPRTWANASTGIVCVGSERIIPPPPPPPLSLSPAPPHTRASLSFADSPETHCRWGD